MSFSGTRIAAGEASRREDCSRDKVPTESGPPVAGSSIRVLEMVALAQTTQLNVSLALNISFVVP